MGKKLKDRYKDAQQQLKDVIDEFKEKNCAGLSDEVKQTASALATLAWLACRRQQRECGSGGSGGQDDG